MKNNIIKKLLLPFPIVIIGLVMVSGCGVGKMGYYKKSGRNLVYEIKRGDTLSDISNRYGVSTSSLASSNNIKNINRLEVGQKIKIPVNSYGSTSDVYSKRNIKNLKPKSSNKKYASVRKTKSSRSKKRRARGKLAYKSPAHEPALVKGKVTKYGLQWPLKGVLYSKFGMRHGRHHDGIDISAPEGTVIRAAKNGKVLHSGVHKGYGNLILIGHSQNLITVYAHNSKNLVTVGDKVKRGEKIALVGQTGRATGPHLHFEVRINTKPRNPLKYLP